MMQSTPQVQFEIYYASGRTVRAKLEKGTPLNLPLGDLFAFIEHTFGLKAEVQWVLLHNQSDKLLTYSSTEALNTQATLSDLQINFKEPIRVIERVRINLISPAGLKESYYIPFSLTLKQLKERLAREHQCDTKKIVITSPRLSHQDVPLYALLHWNYCTKLDLPLAVGFGMALPLLKLTYLQHTHQQLASSDAFKTICKYEILGAALAYTLVQSAKYYMNTSGFTVRYDISTQRS